MTWCGRVGELRDERPTILLLLPESLKDKANEVGVGAEEEGVPMEWDFMDGDPKTLAWEAANRSRLRVGIGVTPKAYAITLANLDPGNPLILVENGETSLRWLGQAAARLVKGLPLPPMDGKADGKKDDPDESQVAEIVAKILREMGLA